MILCNHDGQRSVSMWHSCNAGEHALTNRRLTSLSALQALLLTDDELADYLQHLQGGIYFGNTPPETLSAAHELLTTKADFWRAELHFRTSKQHSEQLQYASQAGGNTPARADPVQGDT